MRILIATDHFPPFIGGGHRWAGLLTAGLARKGHQVTVVTPWHGGVTRTWDTPEGAHVEPIRQLRTLFPKFVRHHRQQHSPPFPDPVSIRDLRQAIKRARPEVILSHGWIGSSVVLAARGLEIPVSISAHDYGYFCATRRLLHNDRTCSGPALTKCLGCAADYYGRPKGWTAVLGVALSRRLIARRITATQSVTAFVDDALHRHLLRNAPTGHPRRFVIPAFIDMSTEDPERNEEISGFVRRLPDEPFILFVGAFRRDKGLEVLFDAYRRLDDPPPLVLLGTVERDTPEFPPDVIALYDVPHEAVVLAWDRALVGVVPSLLPEPLGTVCVEGIAEGVPMIATEPSGMADVLGQGVGLLIPQADPKALAAALKSLLDQPALREQLSQRGRRRADDFREGLVLARYEKMLAELAGQDAAGRTSGGLGRPESERRAQDRRSEPDGPRNLSDQKS